MSKNWLVACVAVAGFAFGGCSDEGTTDYDPNWGGEQFVPNGKADLIDLAPPIAFGESVEGQVDSRELDLYKIALTNGDKFTVTMDVTSGDLAPDASLFFATGGSIGSASFDVTPTKLTKKYISSGSGEYLLVVRAFRNQGAGKYKVSVACTGGPCAGEFLEPVPDEVEVSDIEGCISDAFDCSFADLPRWGGRVGEARAKSIFHGCLASKAMRNGATCRDVCDTNEDTTWLCSSVIKALPFYADQTPACIETLDGCMDTCRGIDGGDADEVWSTEFAMCWENGFNSNCNGFARQMTACGGPVQHETALCYEECQASSGVWMDDLDTICRDDCGECGIQCQRELDWGVTVPTTGVVGDVVNTFMGEADPVVLGDVCITYVRVHQVGDGELAPGVYGFVEDLARGCNADYRRVGEGVHAPLTMLEEITAADAIDAANSAGAANRFFTINGEFSLVH